MKRIALILGIFLFLVTSPVFAKKDEDKVENRKNTVEAQVSVEDECPSDKVWKNHGQYVSCVAKLKQGGAVVSAAAKSDIGKKSEASPAPEASPSPSPSPSASASASPSPSPSPSASPTASPLGIGTTGGIESAAKLEISALIEILKNLIKSLQHLMSS